MRALCVETEVPADELIISHTDLYGIITYANKVFADISGYDTNELIGKSHNIVRHPDMPNSLFANLWETLNEKKMWSGYIKNLRRDGGFYWVYAQVSGLLDKKGMLIGYKSLRTQVQRDKRHELEISYAALKQRDEDIIKLHEWIDCKTYHKIQKLAQEKGCHIAQIIKERFEQ